MRLTASFQNKHRHVNFSIVPAALQQAQDYASYLDTQAIMDSWGEGLKGAQNATDYLDYKQQHPLDALENIQKLGKAFAAIPGQAGQLIQDTWRAPIRTGAFVNTPYNMGHSLSSSIAEGLANPNAALQNAPETLSRIPGRVMDVAGNLPGMQLAGKVLGNSATVQGYKRLVDAGTSADIDMANNIKDLAGNAYNKYAQAEKDSLTGLVDGITGTTRAVGNAISDNVDSLSKNIGSGIHQRMDGLGRRASEVMDSLKPMKDPALKMGRVMGPRVDPTQLNALPFYGPSAPPYMSPASAGNHGTNNTLRDIADTAVHGGELGLGVTLVRKGMLPYINRKDVAAGRAPTFS